jgi:dehydrogenase/reductase SDR family protein 7B
MGLFDSLRIEIREHNISVTQICPSYINTNLGINSLGASKNQLHGKSDKFIESGLDPEKLAKDILYSVYRKEIEVYFSKDPMHIVVCYLRNLLPSLVHKSLYDYYSSTKELFK